MGVQAIDNANLLNICNNCDAVGFTPNLSYTLNLSTGALVVTNSSVIPAGDTLKVIRLELRDQFGGSVLGSIAGSADPSTASINGGALNRSKPLILLATITTTNHINADGSAFYLQAAGKVENWDSFKQS